MAGSERVSVKWAPLEVFTSGEKRFDQATDVWSFGVFMWEIFSYAQTPFTDIHAKRVPRALKQGVRLPNPGCSEDVYKLMLNCWEKLPEDRHTFKTIKVSAFLAPDLTLIE